VCVCVCVCVCVRACVCVCVKESSIFTHKLNSDSTENATSAHNDIKYANLNLEHLTVHTKLKSL
jgi:hypothetical protein